MTRTDEKGSKERAQDPEDIITEIDVDSYVVPTPATTTTTTTTTTPPLFTPEQETILQAAGKTDAKKETATSIAVPVSALPAALLAAEQGIVNAGSGKTAATTTTRYVGGPGGPVAVRSNTASQNSNQERRVVVGSIAGTKDISEDTRLLKQMVATGVVHQQQRQGEQQPQNSSVPDPSTPAQQNADATGTTQVVTTPTTLQRRNRVSTPNLPPGAYAMQPMHAPNTLPEPDAEDQTGPDHHYVDPSSNLWDITGRASNNPHGLAVARMVGDQSNFFATLPQAQDAESGRSQHQRQQEQKAKQFKTQVLLGVLILVVVIMIVLAVSVPNDNQTTVAPTMTPTSNPSLAPTTLEDSILSLLPAETVHKIATEPESAQSKAFDWLMMDDRENFSTLNDERLIQKFALATLFYSTDGNNWLVNTGWLNHSMPECDWFTQPEFSLRSFLRFLYPGFLEEFEPPAAICTGNGIFQHLWLDQNNLVGSLPEELYMLTNLKTLSVGWNRMEGTLSTRIGEMTAMEGLAIVNLRNAGTIPSEIGLLTNLRVFGLDDNDHTGTVPHELFTLTNLQTFSLNFNPQLTFSIPTEIGHFSKLRWFTLDDSTLHGTLPTEIGLAQSLEFLALGGSELTGTLPSEMAWLTKLGYASFHENSMHGTIPTEFGLLSNLYLISFRANNFSGTVPSEFGKLTSLRLGLNFEGNRLLSGSIPTELGLLTHLKELSFLNNNYSGRIPSELGQFTALERLTFGNNSLTGTVPSELSSLAKILYTLELQGNAMLSGTIPAALCTINGTCSGLAMNECYHHVSGLDFDCTSLLCGCGCPCSTVESGDVVSP